MTTEQFVLQSARVATVGEDSRSACLRPRRSDHRILERLDQPTIVLFDQHPGNPSIDFARCPLREERQMRVEPGNSHIRAKEAHAIHSHGNRAPFVESAEYLLV